MLILGRGDTQCIKLATRWQIFIWNNYFLTESDYYQTHYDHYNEQQVDNSYEGYNKVIPVLASAYNSVSEKQDVDMDVSIVAFLVFLYLNVEFEIWKVNMSSCYIIFHDLFVIFFTKDIFCTMALIEKVDF